jgi:hypothetical protein
VCANRGKMLNEWEVIRDDSDVVDKKCLIIRFRGLVRL